MTRTGRRKKKKNSSALLFTAFIAVAIATILLLEYIDYKKGDNSFIFTKLIHSKEPFKKIETFNTRLIHILSKNKIAYDYFPDKDKKYHFKLDIDQHRFNGLVTSIKALTARLKGKLNLAELQGLNDKDVMLYKVSLDGSVTHLLLISRFKPRTAAKKKPEVKPKKKSPAQPQYEFKEEAPPEPAPRKKVSGTPRIAFIIDDMGAYDIGPLELKRLNIPITASVLPDSRRAAEAVHWLKEYNLKALIHLPMQPTNSNGNRYNPAKVITMKSTDTQINALIKRAKRVIPIARGLNNHQGSLATANRPLMSRLLRIIKREGLYFVDSRTIGSSVAYDIAQNMNIRSAKRDVFLDHVQTYSHSLEQIRRLVSVARQNGSAIAIGHPFSTTLRAIKDSIKYIKAKGVKIVFVEELIH
jgi:polysaccharide deacetylase 2 family uncharacterized protein YibQ